MEVMKGRSKQLHFWPHVWSKKIHRWFFLHVSHHRKLDVSQRLQIHLFWHLLPNMERKDCGSGIAETESELGNSTQVSVPG